MVLGKIVFDETILEPRVAQIGIYGLLVYFDIKFIWNIFEPLNSWNVVVKINWCR